ncbi:conserved membrane hypothetical protein [Hyphomicrobiales bacterium]|nr:conserved membrane hypothetical protein [Hyphomicrobiales bacterium]CAH1697703.1 conserved membrane hypothetical protein [Hyphomicrobiales bacterium]CAI0347350.1 conserved membrane hypothetical protein [Hyphomicrobiales bacterium]
MAALLEASGHWPGALWLQRSGTAYLFVNAAHILGIGLLVGAILPLDLRLAGLIRGAPLAMLAPFLTRAAGFGLALALLTGAWLFTVKPLEYAANPAFLWKLGLLGLALANIAIQHRGGALAAALATERPAARVRASALASFTLWLAVLVAGRWVGFV